MHNPSRLPSFGGYSGSEPSPSMIAVGASSLMDDSVPADVFLNQIMRTAPTLPYRERNDYTLPDASAPRTLDTIVMENARFKATIFPWFGGKARHDSAEDFCRLKARRCTTMDRIFILAYCFAIIP